MAICVVRLGSRRVKNEGLRIGTVRRPPRGVPKSEWSTRDLCDVWFPNLAPSELLLREAFPIADERAWRVFRRKFVAELKAPSARRDMELLAALSHHTNVSIGCYCEDEARCHRSILRELLVALGAGIR
jgi:uncharacterized protein YeaO (DUF488 family)